MLNQELSNLIFYKNYSKLLPNGKKESFSQMIDRISNMHDTHLQTNFPETWNNKNFQVLFEKTKAMMQQGLVFGSQRANQFGGGPILNKHMRLYNCSSTYIDRPRVFAEIMHTLLCGAGVGISVQKIHVEKLPLIQRTKDTIDLYIVEDSIEG